MTGRSIVIRDTAPSFCNDFSRVNLRGHIKHAGEAILRGRFGFGEAILNILARPFCEAVLIFGETICEAIFRGHFAIFGGAIW